MNKAALTFALALLPCASALTVWIPEQGQTATLSSTGLVGAAGNRIRLDTDYTSPQEKPLATGFARLTSSTRTTPSRLEVVQGNKVTASYQFAAGHSPNALWGTVRGPCVSETDHQGKSPMLRCFAPDLKSEWARVPNRSVMTVSRGGQFAYVQAEGWGKPGKKYNPDVAFIRYDLNSGQQTPLSYYVPHSAQQAAAHQSMFDTYGAQDAIYLGQELPGERFVVCTAMIGLKWNCEGDIMNRDGKRLLSLEATSLPYIQHVSQDGRRLYAMGNTLQVWDAQTGKRLASIHDPLWQKQNRFPLKVYLTPEGLQAAIITYKVAANGNPDLKQLTAYIYRLSDSKLLNSFPVEP